MQFQITDLYRIKSDRYCWRVQQYVGVYKSGPTVAKATYKTATYHTTLDGAVASLFELMVRDTDAKTIREARAAIHRVVVSIKAAKISIRAAARDEKGENK